MGATDRDQSSLRPDKPLPAQPEHRAGLEGEQCVAPDLWATPVRRELSTLESVPFWCHALLIEDVITVAASRHAFKTIDEYINTFPEGVQRILNELWQTIKEAAPEAEETINYQMPTFTLNGNLVHFAAFKNHIGFYPTPRGIEAFEKELSRYKGAKGSVQIPIHEPLRLPLIRRIVEYRVKENLERKQKKKK